MHGNNTVNYFNHERKRSYEKINCTYTLHDYRILHDCLWKYQYNCPCRHRHIIHYICYQWSCLSDRFQWDYSRHCDNTFHIIFRFHWINGRPCRNPKSFYRLWLLRGCQINCRIWDPCPRCHWRLQRPFYPGDYNTYSEEQSLSINNTEVTFKGNDGRLYVITWTDGTYAYAIDSSAGLDLETAKTLVTQLQ